MNIGDVVEATITVGNATGQVLVLGSGTIGGFTLGNLARVSDTSYTATFTVTNGGTDVAAGADIPVSLILEDPAGNASATYSTAISQTSDSIDANAPTITGVTVANGTYKIGDTALVTITAGNSETGLTVSSATFNGQTLSSLTDA